MPLPGHGCVYCGCFERQSLSVQLPPLCERIATLQTWADMLAACSWALSSFSRSWASSACCGSRCGSACCRHRLKLRTLAIPSFLTAFSPVHTTLPQPGLLCAGFCVQHPRGCHPSPASSGQGVWAGLGTRTRGAAGGWPANLVPACASPRLQVCEQRAAVDRPALDAGPLLQVLSLVNSSNYLHRMTVLSALGALAGSVSKEVVYNSMLPAVVACSKVRLDTRRRRCGEPPTMGLAPCMP